MEVVVGEGFEEGSREGAVVVVGMYEGGAEGWFAAAEDGDDNGDVVGIGWSWRLRGYLEVGDAGAEVWAESEGGKKVGSFEWDIPAVGAEMGELVKEGFIDAAEASTDVKIAARVAEIGGGD